MKQLVAAVLTLSAIVAGIVLATSLSSSAQEDDGSGTSTTTTTVPADPGEIEGFSFGFRSDGELPPGIDEFLSCLREQGIDVPEEVDRSFMFDLRSEDFDGLAQALEACGLPGGPGGLPFLDQFDGQFPDGSPFDGDLFEGLPFGPDGPDFHFEFGPFGIDRDELAACLAELGSFDSVDQVREQLDACLPAVDEFGPLEFGRGFGFDHHFFDQAEEVPVPEGAST